LAAWCDGGPNMGGVVDDVVVAVRVESTGSDDVGVDAEKALDFELCSSDIHQRVVHRVDEEIKVARDVVGTASNRAEHLCVDQVVAFTNRDDFITVQRKEFAWGDGERLEELVVHRVGRRAGAGFNC
jgi:hypothetical protein